MRSERGWGERVVLPVSTYLTKFGLLRLPPVTTAVLLWLLGGLTGAEALTFIAVFTPFVLLALGIRAAAARTRLGAIGSPDPELPLTATHFTLIGCMVLCMAAFAWRFILTSVVATIAALLVLEAAACYLLGLSIYNWMADAGPTALSTRSREQIVAELLGDLFAPEELRRWISRELDPELSQELPSQASSPRDLCAAVASLLQRTGWLDSGIAERLIRARPLRRARIEAVTRTLAKSE